MLSRGAGGCGDDIGGEEQAMRVVGRRWRKRRKRGVFGERGEMHHYRDGKESVCGPMMFQSCVHGNAYLLPLILSLHLVRIFLIKYPYVSTKRLR